MPKRIAAGAARPANASDRPLEGPGMPGPLRKAIAPSGRPLRVVRAVTSAVPALTMHPGGSAMADPCTELTLRQFSLSFFQYFVPDRSAESMRPLSVIV